MTVPVVRETRQLSTERTVVVVHFVSTWSNSWVSFYLLCITSLRNCITAFESPVSALSPSPANVVS